MFKPETLAPFRFLRPAIIGLAAALFFPFAGSAQTKSAPEPDVIVLSNGDTLHGTFENAQGGKVTFKSDPLGEISVPFEKIKELHAAGKFAVLDATKKLRGKKGVQQLPVGGIEISNEAVTVQTAAGPPPPPVPVKNAQYIIDQPTLDKEVFHHPGFLAGWNGAAGAGSTLVGATTSQHTFSGTLGMVRTVPTINWLDPRNRTLFNIAGSYGNTTEPSGVVVPETATKTAIFHADAERDEYFAPRVYGLGLTSFDHNFSQSLQLQQIYGGGLGWTAVKTAKQELDLKGTVQYEKQSFITTSTTVAASDANQNLIGSTFSATYLLSLKLFTFTQGLAYIPAYNNPRAYSANETNTVTFPTFKNLGFSVGTIDSYLNNPPETVPPTKRNSFQFTLGLTYAIKSKY